MAQSSSVAALGAGQRARPPSSPTSSTPVELRRRGPGRNVGATARCTSSDSAALHTEGRWVLALTTMRPGHVEVGRLVDVDVAVAVAVDHVGHRGVLEDRRDQRRAAARDQAVDRGPLTHELDGRLAAGVLDEDQRVGRQAGLLVGLAQHPGDRDVRADGPGRAPQEGGVARLEAQAGGVAGDVRAVLVDDRHDAERHPHLADAQAVRAHPAGQHLAHRVGQRRHLAQAAGHRLDAAGVEPQAVDHRGADAPGLGPLDVARRWRRAPRRPGRRAGRRRRAAPRPSPRSGSCASTRDAALARQSEVRHGDGGHPPMRTGHPCTGAADVLRDSRG